VESENDYEAFAGLISALAASFGKESDEAMLTGYWMGLGDMDLSELRAACAKAIRSMKFMPKPAELREMGGESNVAERAEIAFAAAAKAIGSHGKYASVDFDDPVINATIRSMGGWEKVCALKAEELHKWTKKDFIKMYTAHSNVGVSEEAIAYLAGQVERENTSTGHSDNIPKAVLIQSGLPRNKLLQVHQSPPQLTQAKHNNQGQQVAAEHAQQIGNY